MSIGTADLLQYLSSDTSSTGGAISGSSVTSGIANNVWANVSDAERVAGGTVYRKTFWKNNNGVDPAVKPVMWVPVLPTAMTIDIGVGVNSVSDNDATQGNMTAWTGNAVMSFISDGTDTRVATILGVNSVGVPTKETVTLTSAVEVLSTTTWATNKVWAVFLSGIDAGRTVSIRQGVGGAARGSIPPSKIACWRWITAPSTLAAGIALPDLDAGQSYGMWRRLTWIAGAAATRSNSMSVQMEETA